MALKNLYKILAVVIFTFLLSSCSNPKKDYEPVQQLQKTTEQSIAIHGTTLPTSNPVKMLLMH